MAVRNPEDSSKEMDSYNVLVGVDSVDRGLSRINLVSLKLLTCVTYNFNMFPVVSLLLLSFFQFGTGGNAQEGQACSKCAHLSHTRELLCSLLGVLSLCGGIARYV